jgi:hypothetical protein
MNGIHVPANFAFSLPYRHSERAILKLLPMKRLPITG